MAGNKKKKKGKNKNKINAKNRSTINRGPVFGVFAAIVCIIMLGLTYVFKDMGLSLFKEQTKTLYIWYSDEALTEYLNSAAKSYYEERGVLVIPVYHSSLEYIEAINEASISNNQMPDLYIAGTDTIEKAAMSGLAIPVNDSRNIISTLYFPQVALDAVTYKGEVFAYPFYYETSFLLYNETYLKELAASDLKVELANKLSGVSENSSGEEDEGMADILNIEDPLSVPEGINPSDWEKAVNDKAAYFVPKSIQDLQNIASTHSSPQNVESFLYWDVSDIFYTYFFTGAYMNVGGVNGDDIGMIDICNEDAAVCMAKYQSLNQYFSIDSTEIKYSDVLDGFINGRYIYVIATSDAIARLEKAKEDGLFRYEYNVAMLPGVDNNHEAKGLSYTSAIMINGLGENRNEANDFAAYIAYNNADKLYEKSGKLPASNAASDYGAMKLDVIKKVYNNSVSLPKIIELSNYWLKLEQAYTLVWDGEDPENVLYQLEKDMNAQLGR